MLVSVVFSSSYHLFLNNTLFCSLARYKNPGKRVQGMAKYGPLPRWRDI
jgi:hypothetical protein